VTAATDAIRLLSLTCLFVQSRCALLLPPAASLSSLVDVVLRVESFHPLPSIHLTSHKAGIPSTPCLILQRHIQLRLVRRGLQPHNTALFSSKRA
jgi:hypothetical protein